jgi:hypothetical protein
MRIRLPLAIVTSLLVACSVVGTESEQSLSRLDQAQELPCDVDRVLSRSCRGCHGSPPEFGAPMPLVTYADLKAPTPSNPQTAVYQTLLSRVHAATRPMPPPPNTLSAEDLRVLDAWGAAGAPPASGSAGSCNADGGGSPPPLGCNADQHMVPASAWSMPDDTDDIYVCYGFDVPNTTKRQVVGIGPRIDNARLVHHAVLLQADQSVSPTPAPCPSTSPSWRIVYGWAPGVGNFEFPPEVGYPQEGTTHYVVQVHYNNSLHRPGQTDGSGFDLCTTEQLRPNDADVLELGSLRFQIPPRATTDLTCDVHLPSDIPELHLFSAFPHMHQLGKAISTTRIGTNGAPDIDMGSRSDWDFQNQYYIPIQGLLEPNDLVRTRCVWNNPTDTTVSFGSRSIDEMCFSFTMYWPKITNPHWSWASIPLHTQCRPTQ